MNEISYIFSCKRQRGENVYIYKKKKYKSVVEWGVGVIM